MSSNSSISIPDLADLTAGWWWFQVHPPQSPSKWLCGRLFLPDHGPYFMTVERDGYERTYGISEVEAGINLDLDGHIVLIDEAAPVLHPDDEVGLRRRLSNATRTIDASNTVMSALLFTAALDLGLDEPKRA